MLYYIKEMQHKLFELPYTGAALLVSLSFAQNSDFFFSASQLLHSKKLAKGNYNLIYFTD